MDVFYVDFKNFFYKMLNQRLLLKLRAHGLGDGVINWIEKWLTDTRQRVIVDREISNCTYSEWLRDGNKQTLQDDLEKFI